MLAAILVAQVTVISAAPPLSPEEAVRVLRAARSDRDWTDVRMGKAPELPVAPVRSTWEPGGPFGPFDDRLTRLDLWRRGNARWIHVGYDARGHSHVSGRPIGMPLRFERSLHDHPATWARWDRRSPEFATGGAKPKKAKE